MSGSTSATVRQIASAMGVTRQAVDKRAQKERWLYVVRDDGAKVFTEVPDDVATRLRELSAPVATELSQPAVDLLGLGAEPEDLRKRWKRATDKQRAHARRCVAAIDLYHQQRASGAKASDAKQIVQAERGVSPSALSLWLQRVADRPREEWPALLCPRWVSKSELAPIHPAALNWLQSYMLRASRSTIAVARIALVAEAKNHPEWGDIPSAKSLRKHYERSVPRTTQILRRDGERALEAIVYPHQTRDKSTCAALEEVVGDGHKVDVLTEWPTADGKPWRGRPVLHVVADVYSGMPLAWELDRTENADAVRRLMVRLLREYGRPDRGTFDNGHAWNGKVLSNGTMGRKRFGASQPDDIDGIYPAIFLGGVTYTQVAHGQSKPVERFFKDVCEHLWKSPEFDGAYTGNAPHNKPHDYGTRAIPVEKLREVIDRRLPELCEELGRRSKLGVASGGKSMRERFEESFATRVRQHVTEEQIQNLMLKREERTVSNGCEITILGNRYHAIELAEFQGKAVIVGYDPDDLHKPICIFRHDSPLDVLCKAECVLSVGWRDTDAARRDARGRQAALKAEKLRATLVGTLSARELVGEAPAPSRKRPLPKVVAADFLHKKYTKEQQVIADRFAREERERFEAELAKSYTRARQA